jgi:hypothetical protein
MDPLDETDELAVRLEAYARARLSPDHETSARIRGRVMRDAHRRLARADATNLAPRPQPAPGVATQVVPGRSILTALIAAGLVLVALAGAAAAARPGLPLYQARLAVEAALLPFDANERAAANLDRLEARLDEASAAAASGDGGAVAAAIQAYHELVNETVAAADGSDVRDAALEAALDHHVDVLTDLLGEVPEQARPAIERAIERSDQAADRLHDRLHPVPAADPSNDPPGQPDRPDRTPQGPPTDHPTGPPESGEG